MAQPVERLHAVRHRVGAWAKPLVGQRLPCHQLCHLIRIAVRPRSQIADEILRLATGGDDDDHWLTARRWRRPSAATNAVGSSDEDARVGVLARIHMAFHQTGECLILQKDAAWRGRGANRSSARCRSPPADRFALLCLALSSGIEFILSFREAFEYDRLRGICTVGKELGKLLALCGIEFAEHPVDRVVVGVAGSAGMPNTHAHTRIIRGMQATVD